MLDNLIRRDIFVDFPTVTNITFRYLNLSQWKKFEKKKSQKTKPKNTETTKESDFLPFLLHPLSIVVQTMQNLYYTRFKKKKKLLLQTPGPNFFSDGQTEERSGWKANV